MTTIKLYHKHKAGEVSKEAFLYEVRRDSNLPWITNLTSYDDAVKILKNKGVISEVEMPTNEAKGSINDPGLMAMRAKKDADKKKKEEPKSDKNKVKNNKAKIDALLKQKKEIESEMENDPEVEKEGGKKADEYGDKLDKIDAKIKKLRQLNEADANVATDPAVDRVNPYFLKKGVMKLLAKEKELTNDSYINALNKAAKQLLANPHAFDEDMFANAKDVEKADSKLETQEVKKNNHVDKANEMKKVKAKSLKESTIDELVDYLKKKELVNEDAHWNYTVGSEVHTPNGSGKVVEIVGGTLTVEMEDGTQQDVQINTVDHFTQQAKEDPAAQEAEPSVADMWAKWDKEGHKPFGGMVNYPSEIDLAKIKQYMEVYGHDKEKMKKLKEAIKKLKEASEIKKNPSTGMAVATSTPEDVALANKLGYTQKVKSTITPLGKIS